MRRLNDESIQRAAAASPGERIEQAIQLSDVLLTSATVIEKPLPPSLPALYRARRRRGPV